MRKGGEVMESVTNCVQHAGFTVTEVRGHKVRELPQKKCSFNLDIVHKGGEGWSTNAMRGRDLIMKGTS